VRFPGFNPGNNIMKLTTYSVGFKCVTCVSGAGEGISSADTRKFRRRVPGLP